MSTKRVTEAGWGSEDELLSENNQGGISAFTVQEEFDEDALLGLSDAEGQGLGLEDIGDEELIEVEIEEEEDHEWTENTAELAVDSHLPEQEADSGVHTQQEQYTEELQHQDMSAHLDTGDYQEDYPEETTTSTKLLEDEDSDEDEETNTRERFKSERQQISTINSRTKPIPEKLELAKEDEAALRQSEELHAQRPYRQNSRGGGGGHPHTRGGGRGGGQFVPPYTGQYRPLMQQPHHMAAPGAANNNRRPPFQPVIRPSFQKPAMRGGINQQYGHRGPPQGQRMQMMHHQGQLNHHPQQNFYQPEIQPQRQMHQRQPQQRQPQQRQPPQLLSAPPQQQRQPQQLLSAPPQQQTHVPQRSGQQMYGSVEVDYGHSMHQTNQLPDHQRVQSVDYNHGQRRQMAAGGGASSVAAASTIHVNPHFKGTISMNQNQPVSRRPLEEAFGFNVSSTQPVRQDPLDMLDQRIQQQNRNQYNQGQPVNNSYNTQAGSRPGLSTNQHQDQDMRPMPLIQDVPSSQPHHPQLMDSHQHPRTHQPAQQHQQQPRFQSVQQSHSQPHLQPHPRQQFQVPQNVRPVLQHQMRPQNPPPLLQRMDPPRGQPIRTVMRNNSTHSVQHPRPQQSQPKQPMRGKSIPTLGSPPQPTQPVVRKQTVQQRLGQQRMPSQQNIKQQPQQKLPQQQQQVQAQKPVAQTVTPVVNKPVPLTKEELEQKKKLDARAKRFQQEQGAAATTQATAPLRKTTTVKLGTKRLSSGSLDDTSPPKQLKIERTVTNEKVTAPTNSPAKPAEDVYSSEELYKKKLLEQKKMRENIQKRKELNRQKRADSLKQEVEERQAIEGPAVVQQPQQQQTVQQNTPVLSGQQQIQQQQQAKQQPLRQRNVQTFNNPTKQGGKKKVFTMTKAQFLRNNCQVTGGSGPSAAAALQRQVVQVGQMAQNQNRVVVSNNNQQSRKVISVNNTRKVITAGTRVTRVSIDGLTANTSKQAIVGMATSCGNILNVELLQHGKAFVTFDSMESAEKFKKKYHMHMIELSRVRVDVLNI